jgi:Bacterial Ig-like domain (group 3)/FG-GAP-like repeat
MKRTTTIRRSALARCVVVARLRKLLSAGAAAFSLLLALPAAAQDQLPPTDKQLIVADFNHDGIPDALIPSPASGGFTLSFGSVPYGTFNPVSKLVSYPSGCTRVVPNGVVVGDFNGDGFPDIAMLCTGSPTQDSIYTIYILLAHGDGTFTVGATTYPGLSSLVVGDFYHTGVPSLVTVGSTGTDSNEQSIFLLKGNGDGTFTNTTSQLLLATSYTTAVAVDVDGDGYTDLVLGNFGGANGYSVDIYDNNKNGYFGNRSDSTTPTTSIAIGNPTADDDTTILTGNFFGTARLTDLAVVNIGSTPGIYVLKNTSTGGTDSFATPITVASPGLVSAVTGNFVSGFSDFLVSNGTTLTVLANDGTGNFTNSYATLSIASTSVLYAAADANGDGHADVYTATPAANAATLTVNLVSGSATAVTPALSLPVGTDALTAVWSGNVNFSGSTATGSQTVNLVATTIAATSSKNPSVVGNSVTFTGTVMFPPSGNFTPTGTLTFMDGTTVLGTLPIGDGDFTDSVTTNQLTGGTHSIIVAYSGDSVFAASSFTISQVVSQITPTITWANPAAINYGTPLSATQLDATATSPIIEGPLPGTFVYTPAAGTLLNPGTQTLSVLFTPTDTLDYTTATATVTIQVNQPIPVLTSFTPNTAVIGAGATTITITGSGFVTGTVAQVNGTTISTTIISPTSLTAVIPASDFTAAATLQVTVLIPATGGVSSALPFTVVAPPATGTITAPATTPPGSQPTVSFSLAAPYPVPLTATFTLTDKSGIASGAVDPSVAFASGGTTFSVVIPAGSTTIPSFQIQAGTIAATITVPVTLTVNGVVVNSGTLAATIVVPAAVPAVTATALARSTNTLTVTETGFSNTREIVSATFHFVPVSGATLTTTDFTVPVGPEFAAWFANPTSLTYGSAFSYMQVFNVSGNDAASIASVQVTLTNSIGQSTTQTAQ